MSKYRVLFVCLGNICRSPMAEGIFIDLVKEKNIEHLFKIDSAGTSGHHAGELADPRMRKTAKKYGVDLIHRSRKLSFSDFYEFDYILAMDDSNLNNIQDLYRGSTEQVFISKMRDFDLLAQGADVPDPYYGFEDGFEEVYAILKRSCAQFLDDLLENKIKIPSSN